MLVAQRLDLTVHPGDGKVELGDLLDQRRSGGLEFGGDRGAHLVRKGLGGAGCQPSSGALDQPAQRVDQPGASPHERTARVDQVQILLALRAAMADGREQLRVAGGEACQFLGVVAVVLALAGGDGSDLARVGDQNLMAETLEQTADPG
jgi:hypothetical protein